MARAPYVAPACSSRPCWVSVVAGQATIFGLENLCRVCGALWTTVCAGVPPVTFALQCPQCDAREPRALDDEQAARVSMYPQQRRRGLAWLN